VKYQRTQPYMNEEAAVQNCFYKARMLTSLGHWRNEM